MPKKATEAAAPPGSRRQEDDDHPPPEDDGAVELTWDHVATRAYYIPLEEGGDPTENWLRAERELIAA